MKKILFTIALLISFSSFGQDEIKQGLVTEYYESGEVKSKTNYVDGKREGEATGYYESGNVNVEVYNNNSPIPTEVIFYYESGKVFNKLKYITFSEMVQLLIFRVFKY